VLRLIGSGPSGPIAMALGRRPLRTKQLTERVDGFSPRSIYRCIGKLEACGLVERASEPGVPSRVSLRLTEPAGRNLFRLLRSFGSGSTAGLSTSGSALRWDSLCLLGELWEARFAEELSRGPRSLVELLDRSEGLTYHQVRRRAGLLVAEGLLSSSSHNANGRRYELTERGRRCMAAIAAIGRWRHRHFLADGTPGLEIEELATVLRSTLPLVALPKHAGMSLELAVAGPEDKYGERETAAIGGEVGPAGEVAIGEREGGRPPDGSAAATVNTWFAALLDGNRGRIRVRGDLGLVDDCLTRLYSALWTAA
jgi:DNA-binding HxlR family transcriptional regulator